MTPKSKISQAEYLQLVGFLSLAKKHNEWLKNIAKGVRDIVGEKEEGGHADDAVYCDYSADEMLSKLGIKVQ